MAVPRGPAQDWIGHPELSEILVRMEGSVSQHIYTKDNLRIVLGYDRPLDYVFCTIQREGEYIYTNLADENAGTSQQDVNYFRKVLADNKITVPEQMFTEVENDQRNRIGNRVVNWPV
jgi:hypothetical protein